jgi:hypothetical protein
MLALMMQASPTQADAPRKRSRQVIGGDDSDDELTAEQMAALEEVDRRVQIESQGTDGTTAPSVGASNVNNVDAGNTATASQD